MAGYLDRAGRHAPSLLRTIIVPGAAGSVAGLLGAGLLIASGAGSPGSLGDLLLGPAGGPLPIALLASGFVVTFGSAAIGAAIMSIADEGRE